MSKPGVFTAFCAVLFSTMSVGAGTYIKVPKFPGSTYTAVSGINDQNIIVGTYSVGSGYHGFFGTLDGQYTSFDYVSGSTGALGIGEDGSIVGYGSIGKLDHAFIRNPDGTFVTVTKNGDAIKGVATDITNGGLFVGTFVGAYTSHAFEGHDGKYDRNIKLPFDATNSYGWGVNASGVVVGYFADNNYSHYHGFIFDGQKAKQIDYPGADSTYLEGINDDGLVSGWECPLNGNSHAFILNPTSGTYTLLDAPHSSNTRAGGINNAGWVVLTSDKVSYVYCPKPRKTCARSKS